MLILKLFLLKINKYLPAKDETPYFLINLLVQDVILVILAKPVVNLKVESMNVSMKV